MRAVLSAVRHRLPEATVIIVTDMHFPVTRAEASGEICRCCDRPARLAKVWAAAEVSMVPKGCKVTCSAALPHKPHQRLGSGPAAMQQCLNTS